MRMGGSSYETKNEMVVGYYDNYYGFIIALIPGMDVKAAGHTHTGAIAGSGEHEGWEELTIDGNGALYHGSTVCQENDENSSYFYVLPAGRYYLGEDITLTNHGILIKAGTVELCLNGHTLTTNGVLCGIQVGCSYDNRWSTNTALCLYDESGNSGKITSDGTEDGVCVRSHSGGSYNGMFIMNGGTIFGFSCGVSVFVSQTSFTMNGGNICGNHDGYNGCGGGVHISSGTFTMNGGTIDGGFFAQYNDYATVTFNKNDGTGTSETQYIKKSTATALKNVVVSRAACSFNGWNSVVDGSGDTYTAGQNVTLTNDLNLYAQWIFDPATAPTIDAQPINISLAEGYSSGNSISVNATAATDTTYSLSYQWYSCDDTSKTNPQIITGATAADYTVPTGKTVETEYYYCDVTATRTDNNQTETASSDVATVTITAQTVINPPINVPSTPDHEPTPVPNPEIIEHKNPDGSITTKTTTRHDNGSVTVEEKTEYENGSYVLVSETKDKDGKLLTRTDETKTISKKGTATVNTKTVNANGSTLEKTVKTTKKGYTESSTVTAQTTKKGNTIVEVKNTNSDGYALSMEFTVKGGIAVLKSFDITDGFAVIPDEITVNGVTYPVGSVNKNAFKNNKEITNATIGENVSVIGSKAFYGAKNLDKIFIYGNIEKIGKGAFKGIAKDALFKIKATKDAYKKLVELIKASGVGKNVKFKRIK